MLITFTVKDQKITHDLKDTLVANSSGIVQAKFALDGSWDSYDIVAVFSNSSRKKPIPVPLEGADTIDIPAGVLKPGKLYISVIGFGTGDEKKTTLGWDIQQAITVAKAGAMSDCDLLRHMTPHVADEKVASDCDVEKMLDDVFGDGSAPVEPEKPSEPTEPSVDEENVASDGEVHDMLDGIFGAQ